MSVADNFDHIPDAGFVRRYDAGSARRQFNVSLMLIIVIALAASAIGFLVKFDRPSDVRFAEPISAPSYVGALTR